MIACEAIKAGHRDSNNRLELIEGWNNWIGGPGVLFFNIKEVGRKKWPSSVNKVVPIIPWNGYSRISRFNWIFFFLSFHVFPS